MIGIYKITKIDTGKSYIGQSNDIERRFKEHQTKGEKSRIPVDIAIKKYGINAFSYEIIEECLINELNDREQYWIEYYDTFKNGYNCSIGGLQQSMGENNGRSKLAEKDVIKIRQAYAAHKKQKEIYEEYKDIISFSYFQNLWQGRSWAHIMPEVFTEENKQYYIYQNSNGSNGIFSAFTDEEIMKIRQRYVNESAKQIYEDYKHRVAYQTFQAMLWGRTYKNLPIYKKKEKKWINN